MEKLRNSPAEMLKKIEITNIEHEYLDRVFEFMIKHD